MSTPSRRTAILAELAQIDERMLVAPEADRDRLWARQRELEVELSRLFVGVAANRSHHSTWGPAFRRGSPRE